MSLNRKLWRNARNLQSTRFVYFSADTVSVTLDCVVCISVELRSWLLNTAFCPSSATYVLVTGATNDSFGT